MCAVLVPTLAFYEKGDVVELTSSNFDRLVLQSDEIWVVEVSILEAFSTPRTKNVNCFRWIFSFMHLGVDIVNN